MKGTTTEEFKRRTASNGNAKGSIGSYSALVVVAVLPIQSILEGSYERSYSLAETVDATVLTGSIVTVPLAHARDLA